MHQNININIYKTFNKLKRYFFVFCKILNLLNYRYKFQIDWWCYLWWRIMLYQNKFSKNSIYIFPYFTLYLFLQTGEMHIILSRSLIANKNVICGIIYRQLKANISRIYSIYFCISSLTLSLPFSLSTLVRFISYL